MNRDVAGIPVVVTTWIKTGSGTIYVIQYTVNKSLWTPDHHPGMWSFLATQSMKHTTV